MASYEHLYALVRAHGEAGRTEPHCDDSKTISELGTTPRDLRVTVECTVRWLADHGYIAATPARQAT